MLRIALFTLSPPAKTEAKHVSELKTSFISAFNSFAAKAIPLFDTLWEKLLVAEEKPTQFLIPLENAKQYKIENPEQYKIDLLKNVPTLYRVAYSLDLIKTVSIKFNESVTYKKNLFIARQQLQRNIQETIEWGNDQYTPLAKKANQLFEDARKKVDDYKAELKQPTFAQKNLREFEEKSNAILTNLQIKLNHSKKEIDKFIISLKDTTDEKTSIADLLIDLRNLRNEINRTTLPSAPEMKTLFIRPNIEILNNQLLIEIRQFITSYTDRINHEKAESNNLAKGLAAITSDAILNPHDTSALSNFFSPPSREELSISQKNIAAHLYAQRSWVHSMPELERLSTHADQLFTLAKATDPRKVNNEISESLAARAQITQDEEKEASNPSSSANIIQSSLATLENNFMQQKNHLQMICQNILSNEEETGHTRKNDKKSKFQELLLVLKREIIEAEEKATAQFTILHANKQAIKNKALQECKELMDKLESLHISKIITSNKQRKLKEEKDNLVEEKEASHLVEEINKKTKHLTANRHQVTFFATPALFTQRRTGKSPTALKYSSQLKQDVKKSDPSLYKKYFSAASFTSIIGLSATITGIAVLASNPLGWAVGTLLAGLSLLAGSIALFKKAYYHYQKKQALEKLYDDNERQFSHIQLEVLEDKNKHSPNSLLLIQKLGIKFIASEKNGDIRCQLSKRYERTLPLHHPPLLFNNKTGQLYFNKTLSTKSEKVFIREEKDIDYLRLY